MSVCVRVCTLLQWLPVGGAAVLKLGLLSGIRKLVDDRTAKARLKNYESEFFGDAALYTVTRQAVERVVVAFVTTAAGL